MSEPKEKTTPATYAPRGKVRVLKCLKSDGTSGGQEINGRRVPTVNWPQVGETVQCSDPDRAPKCGGGIHGWPWGLFIGDGADPDYSADWVVFEADQGDVVSIDGGKVKCVGVCGVIARGRWWHCLSILHDDRVRLIDEMSDGSASQTGDRGSSSQTGDRGSSSQTGYMGSSSQTGDMGSSSQTGDMGSSSQTGYMGSSSQTGYRGSSSQTGDMGSSSQTGDRGSSSQTGYMGSSSQTGYMGSSSQTGYMGSSSQTGDMGSSSQTGDRGSSSQTGDMGSSSQTGDRGSSSQTGDMGSSSQTGRFGVASISGDEGTIELGSSCRGVVCGDNVTWIVHTGAVLLNSWIDGNSHPWKAFDSAALGLRDGERVTIVKGEIQREQP